MAQSDEDNIKLSKNMDSSDFFSVGFFFIKLSNFHHFVRAERVRIILLAGELFSLRILCSGLHIMHHAKREDGGRDHEQEDDGEKSHFLNSEFCTPQCMYSTRNAAIWSLSSF